MPQITIDESTFERLQVHAKPLVDTVDSVINRGLDALEALGSPPTPAAIEPNTARKIDPRALPSLTHTKVLDAVIEGDSLAKTNWNAALDEMLRRTSKHIDSFELLRKTCPANMVQGRKEDDGYSYLPEIDISVQGQDSNAACRAIVALAQNLGIGVDITFMWRPKDKAAFPGERGRLYIPA